MSVSVEIEIEKAEDVIAVPVDAIKTGRNDQSFVFIKNNDGGRERREVETGLSDDVMIEVKTGLSEGEEIFINDEIMPMQNNSSNNDEERFSNNSGSIIPMGPGAGRNRDR